MNTVRVLLTTLGFGCLVVGLLAAFSGGGTEEQIRSLGTTLILAGAIIIGAIIISSAILERSNRN